MERFTVLTSLDSGSEVPWRIGPNLGASFVSSRKGSFKTLSKQGLTESAMVEAVGRRDEAIDRRLQDTLTSEQRVYSGEPTCFIKSRKSQLCAGNEQEMPRNSNSSRNSMGRVRLRYWKGLTTHSDLNAQIALSSSLDHKHNA
jgi:hypothetical protein